MRERWANNAREVLDGSIGPSDTSFSVEDGGSLPEAVSGVSFFYVTLVQGATREIVRVTEHVAASGNLVVVRGQQGTTAASFTAGALVEQRITAGSLVHLANEVHYIKPTTTYYTAPLGVAPGADEFVIHALVNMFTFTDAAPDRMILSNEGSSRGYYLEMRGNTMEFLVRTGSGLRVAELAFTGGYNDLYGKWALISCWYRGFPASSPGGTDGSVLMGINLNGQNVDTRFYGSMDGAYAAPDTNGLHIGANVAGGETLGGAVKIAGISYFDGSYPLAEEMFSYFEGCYGAMDILSDPFADDVWSVRRGSPGSTWVASDGSGTLTRSGSAVDIQVDHRSRWW
jgi:hypothetical protein